MDGNGRWAEGRGVPRSAGHRAGGRAVERVVTAAPAAGIRVLTLYAFSSDNWSRPMPEVATLMHLFAGYLRSERERAVANGVAIEVLGRRDRLSEALRREITATEAATAGGARLLLRLAVDYSARDALLGAAHLVAEETAPPDRARFADLVALATHGRPGTPPVDLLIRTGGEQRLSDFLLWECAYAELFFLDLMWPEFSPGVLDDVLARFRTRERRFGALPASASRGHLHLIRR
ncbi:MAG: di-trans,poly-cis-decaprenylcistransferase [Gemmatimonadales bacterium]|nr:di-trans,poly-cis-decaprenylcistransferase [Gemmatimonadales bacterium]